MLSWMLYRLKQMLCRHSMYMECTITVVDDAGYEMLHALEVCSKCGYCELSDPF